MTRTLTQKAPIDIIGDRRFCIVVLESSGTEQGFVPSVVIDGESGHYPLSGQGNGAAPWYWGPTFEDAQAAADAYNRRLGLTDRDVAVIIASSMRTAHSRAKRGPRREAQR